MNAFSTMNENQPAGVKSATRVLDILEWLAMNPEPAGLQQVVNHFGYPKSSTLALMTTLLERGYVDRDPRDRYRLRDALRTRWAAGDAGQLLVAAHPAMAALQRAVRETINLGVMNADRQVQVLAKLASPDELRYEADSTQPRPAYCTAMGRILLAFAPPGALDRYLRAAPFPRITPATVTGERALRKLVRQARAEGLAIVLEEFAIGGCGAAAPIFDARGQVAGALNVATVTPRFEARRALILRELKRHAVAISRRLGYRAAPSPHDSSRNTR